MIKSAYIHIPFCNKICTYCDFCKIYYNKKIVSKYLEILEWEIRNTYQNEILDTIYIGGGTPSCLDLEELERLFEIIKLLRKSDNCEITIECNFDSITKDKLDFFKDYGVNRLSFGLETIDKEVLKKINRDIDIERVKDIISYSKRIGITNINIDLMYGFSFSNFTNLKKDLEFIIDLDVEHISTYSLMILENTKLYIDKEKNISEDEDYKLYQYINDILTKNNYNHYEISNFSKSGYESRHNLGYWNNLEYYGFGLSSSSYIDNKRMTNTKSMTKYLDRNLNKEEEVLTIEDKMIYEMILGLRLEKGVSFDSFYKKYNKRLDHVFKIDELIKDKCLEIENGYLKVPFDKWYILNKILINFLEVNNE